MRLKISVLFIIAALLISQASCKAGVFVGGGLADDNAEVWETFLSLGTIQGYQNVGIVTAATEDSNDSFSYYDELLPNTYGVKNLSWIPIDVNHTENAFSQSVVDQVNQMTVIWFAGGDQERLVECFFYTDGNNKKTPTPVYSAILAKYNAGELVVGGSSAGADIQQGTPMVTGGLSWDALVYGSFPSISTKYPDDLTYDPVGGFDFFDYGFLDTHVGTRGRQGRMLRLVWDLRLNGSYMYGLDENTALVLQDDVGYVIGENGMYVVDISQAQTFDSRGNGAFEIENVLFSYLTEGDYYYFNNRTVEFASFKNNIKGHELHKNPYSPTDDIFDASSSAPGETFTKITTDLFDCYGAETTYGYTYENDPTYRLDFDKIDGTGYYGTKGGVEFISYANLSVKVTDYSGNRVARPSREDEESIIDSLILSP